MNLTLSVDDEVVAKARRKADAEEFVRLSNRAKGNVCGWKFNRDEAHQRR